MTVIQEAAMTLFMKETLDKVKSQFKNLTESILLQSFGMDFRLFLANDGNINLELLFVTSVPPKEKNIIDLSLAELNAIIEERIYFFKPVGFYQKVKGFLSNSIEITIVKEFEEAIDYLQENYKTISFKAHRMSLKENAVLAAFSMETLVQAINYQDASFFSNGLKTDIFMSFDGFPQVFVDDQYKIPGPIGAYMLKDEDSINPSWEYKSLYDKFCKMNLLSALKGI